MTTKPKSVDNVGGEDNADLIFQLAIDDTNSTKDWVRIAEAVENLVSPEACQRWFEAIISPQKRSRWTKEEEDSLRSYIFPKQQLKSEEICNLFQNRSKKAVINKISRLRNNISISKIENVERQPQLQNEKLYDELKKISVSDQLLNKENK